AMRTDFFYRLNVLRIDVPPLRERIDDIPLLVQQFIREDQIARQADVTEVSEDVLAQLRSMRWPGNVRELRNVLRQSVALHADGPVPRSLRQIPVPIPPSSGGSLRTPHPTQGFRLWMREREREYLSDLTRCYRTMTQQAIVSGLPQRTLYRKLRNLGFG